MKNESSNTKNEGNQHVCGWCCCCGQGRGRYVWGIFFLLLGGYYVARAQGWIMVDFPFWPAVAVLFGLYLLIGKGLRRS